MRLLVLVLEWVHQDPVEAVPRLLLVAVALGVARWLEVAAPAVAEAVLEEDPAAVAVPVVLECRTPELVQVKEICVQAGLGKECVQGGLLVKVPTCVEAAARAEVLVMPKHLQETKKLVVRRGWLRMISSGLIKEMTKN